MLTPIIGDTDEAAVLVLNIACPNVRAACADADAIYTGAFVYQLRTAETTGIFGHLV